ncbi:thioredoxin family protein [Streptomyces sp. NPDC001621]|uniref:thioredoxin family protein n=1 Tax=Streptomyces sp. NPDC001621 TaxID=3364594 RepID=UPI0036B2C311
MKRQLARRSRQASQFPPHVSGGAVIEVTGTEQYDELLNSEPRVIAMFTAAWCAPCKAITPEFERLSRQYGTVAFLSIDVSANEENEELADREGISGMPAFIALRNGRKMETIKGAFDEGLRRMVRGLAAS